MRKKVCISLLLLFSTVTGALSQSMIISGGGDHAVALCNKGEIYAWGANGKGQLCLENPPAGSVAYTPSKVNAGGLTFSMLTAGSGGHSVALACNGIVYAFGSNGHGQCGVAPANVEDVVSGSPNPIPCGAAPGYDLDGNPGGKYLGGVKYIAATSAASLAILNDGRLVVWGGNESNVPGEFLKQDTYEPVFITDASGKPLENVIHVAGGDNNLLIIVGDSPDAKVGTVYSMGNWNGRGGAREVKDYTAAPVIMGDGTGSASSPAKHLTNVRTTGLADTGGFAVDGTTGYVYAWGDAGWWGPAGLQMQYANGSSTLLYAEKVTSGEYETITGESFLTDVVQVVGGNGSGSAVTKEGHVLFWGSNEQISGGTVPSTAHKALTSTQKIGPIFANYCAGEHNGIAAEHRVDDAVAIARGDLMTFIVNKDGEYYVWGAPYQPGKGKSAIIGTLGLEKDMQTDASTCLRHIKVTCDAQDLCPEAFMVGPRYKCPGQPTSLYSGFSPLRGSENSYFFKWSKDGVALNSATETSSQADRDNDPYNMEEIDVTEPGLYRVDIYYTGLKVPCDNCPETFAEIEVKDMEMPVDPEKPTSCVAAANAKATASDVINFEFGVNTKFYKTGTKTSWEVYASQTGGTALETITATAGGSTESFTASGDNVTTKYNAPVDTTYSIWIEDVTKVQEFLFNDAKIEAGTVPAMTGAKDMSDQAGCFFTFMATSPASLGKVQFVLQGNGQDVANVKVVGTLYKADLCTNGTLGYLAGAPLKSVSETVASLSGTSPEIVTLDFDGYTITPNSVRGTVYILAFYTSKQVKAYTHTATASSVSLFGGAIKGIEGGLDYKVKPECYSSPTKDMTFVNMEFFKLTDYTCGRIELTSKYYCPPCNQPDGPVTLEVSGTPSTGDTLKLCAESDPVKLTVTGIAKASDPSVSFDVLWFLNKVGADATALNVTKGFAQGTNTLGASIHWEEAKAGMVEKYYVKIRDNEKPEASACFVIDSIIVKYNEKPVAPVIPDFAFCMNAVDPNALDDAISDSAFKGYTINWYDGTDAATTQPDHAAPADDSKETVVISKYSVTSVATGCKSDMTSFKTTYYPVPSEPLEATAPFCKGDNVTLVSTSPVNSYTVNWLQSDKATAVAADLSSLAAGTYDYYYTLTSAAPANCVSDPIAYSFTVKDYASVTLDTTMTCGKTEVIATTTPAAATLTYELDGTAVSTTTFENPTYKGDIGAVVASVSATGYCDATSSPLNLYVKETATEPTVSKVTYLKSDAVGGTFKDLLAQNPNAAVAQGATLNWYANATGGSAISCPVPPYPAESETADKTYSYYVSATNADGCESDRVEVEVTVFLTPAPTPTHVTYCVNSGNVAPLHADINNPSGTGTYTLNWYGLDGTKLGANAPTPDVSVAGKYTYQVSQLSSDGAESSKVDLDVVVYGVDKPTLSATNETAHCAGTGNGSVLQIDIVRDASAYKEADGFVWSLKNAGGTYDEVATPAPVLNVTETTVYDYQVYQTYTIASTGEVCKGEPINTSVTVTYVPKLTTKEVLYLKASANASGSFSNDLLAQDPSAVSGQVAGATLQWYESDCSTAISGTPTPTIDPSVKQGDDQNLTYCVSQVLNGCESERVQIKVRISDALPPTPYAYHYCEGQTMEDLKAEINPQPGKSAADYELYWYITQPASTTDTPDFVGDIYSLSSAKAELDAQKGVTTYTYYVAQRDKETDAVSATQAVVITVYPKPVITLPSTPDPVCEQAIDLTPYRAVNNVAEPLTFEYSFKGAAATTSSTADKSGDYSLEAYYSLPVTPSALVVVLPNGGECRSTEPAVITVQIDTLQNLTIDANATTCPNTPLESMEAIFTTNVSSPIFAWSSDDNLLVATNAAKVATKDLPGAAGKEYTFNLTVVASACTLSASHTVKLGDGPVDGKFTATESVNADLAAGVDYPTKGEAIDIYTCGTEVTLVADFVSTENDFVWSVVSGNGTLSDAGKQAVVAPVNVPTTYRLTYTNKCSTSVEVNVIPIPVAASAVLSVTQLCEGDTSSIALKIECSEVPTVEWKKNGVAYSPTNGNSTYFKFDPATPDDSGEYAYTVTNRGCSVTNENLPLSLLVKPYIQVQDKTAPYIVTRGEAVEMTVDVTLPTANDLQDILWKENNQPAGAGASLSLAAVEGDHTYEITLSDPNYCDATTQIELLVDAKLELVTSFDDTLCYDEYREFVIDTTGTGPFRTQEPVSLKVVETQEGSPVADITNQFILQDDGRLVASLSPKKDASYIVSFDYNGQHRDTADFVTVLQPIEIELPAVQTVCEGTEVTLALPKVAPDGTVITWHDDATVKSSDATSITVDAAYNADNATNHRSTYTYGFTASYSGCQNIDMAVDLIVDEPIVGEVEGETPICEGAKTSLVASSFDAAEYIWTASDDSSYYEMGATITAKLDTSRTFLLAMTRGACTKDTTFDVVVTSIPEITGVDSVGLRERKILLNPMKGTAPYQFALDNENAIFPGDVAEQLTFTSHVVYVIDNVGCINTFRFSLEPPLIYPKNVLTPDADGVNDEWVVTNLREVYPDAVVRIYDRYGKKLVEYKGADNGWDGTYNGKLMPSTDYWYEIEIEEIEKTYVGHFTMMRR